MAPLSLHFSNDQGKLTLPKDHLVSRHRHTAKRRARAHESAPPAAQDGYPALERLVEAGLHALVCFQAWLWAEAQGDPLALPQRFTALAPHSFMRGNVLPVLAIHGLLTESAVQSRLWPAAGVDTGIAPTQWRLADDFGSSLEAEMMAALALSRLRSEPSFIDEVCDIWRCLAAAEVVSFLAAELMDHQFDERWAWNVEPQIAAAAQRLSMAQGFYFCWLAVRDLASAYLRFPGSRDRLPYTLRHAFESKLSKAQSEGWITRPFARHIRCPESAMAAVFSTTVTQLGDGYLLLPPCPENLRF